MKKITWVVFAALCILIGLYPLKYFIGDRMSGLLQSKTEAILNSPVWNVAFYGHIIFGGIALLVGWAQFSKWLRVMYTKAHRIVGKIYLISVLISGICGIYIGYYATGGLISMAGFIALGIIWLFTSSKAYIAVKNKDFNRHEAFMIFSYAACFAAVTLRIWLPMLVSYFHAFIPAYRIVAWLSWVPNLVVSYWIVDRKGLMKKVIILKQD